MKKILILLALFPLFSISQTVYNDAVDGAIYFKIKNSEHINLPQYNSETDNLEVLAEFNEIHEIAAPTRYFIVLHLVLKKFFWIYLTKMEIASNEMHFKLFDLTKSGPIAKVIFVLNKFLILKVM